MDTYQELMTGVGSLGKGLPKNLSLVVWKFRVALEASRGFRTPQSLL